MKILKRRTSDHKKLTSQRLVLLAFPQPKQLWIEGIWNTPTFKICLNSYEVENLAGFEEINHEVLKRIFLYVVPSWIGEWKVGAEKERVN